MSILWSDSVDDPLVSIFVELLNWIFVNFVVLNSALIVKIRELFIYWLCLSLLFITVLPN
ncbi:hypothetical protein VCHA37P193_90022 [Vibrio chagasii]|nr:hypothetical protein VCHA41O249_120144 [Vibrio chagasii]CAH7142346.1 hypothetical protein VCHA42O253_100022 [Vibrio chagasii]CAH7403656.1 hypothetical protein VCHA37P193_90022 [Vibrio chagasii]